jgi:hypothetical protein
MSRSVFHIIYCYKSGLGSELARTAPVIKRMEATHQIYITSFHCFMYDRRFKLNPLAESHIPKWIARPEESGICFACDKRQNGPFAWHNLAQQAKSFGWPVLSEDIAPKEQNLYTAASWLADRLAPSDLRTAKSSVLSRGTEKPSHFVLNLFGGAAPQKGLTHPESVRSITSHLARSLPGTKWLLPVLPHQLPQVAACGDLGSNFRFIHFPYESRELAELFHCSGVVTVEGGGLHVAVEQNSPTILLSSKGWLEKVRDLLPPEIKYQTVLTELTGLDQSKAANQITDWVKRLG